MDGNAYQKWFESVDELSDTQRSEVLSILEGGSSEAEMIAALEGRLMAERVCPHCKRQGATCRGRSNGLRRFICSAGCGKTFNALTGTPLAHLHYKGRWFEFAGALRDGDTVRKSAARCEVAVSTKATPLNGIVEADETYVLESHKGSRAWSRAKRARPAPRRRTANRASEAERPASAAYRRNRRRS